MLCLVETKLQVEASVLMVSRLGIVLLSAGFAAWYTAQDITI